MNNGKRIRLAIPSANPGGLQAERSGHFGRCECFTVVEFYDQRQEDVFIVENVPHTEGGCLGPVNLLAESGVNCIAVSGIGLRPLLGFRAAGIDVLLGQGCKVMETVDAFTRGNLEPVSDEDTCGGH